MRIRKIAGTAAIACAMGAAGLGLGAGPAQADRIWIPDIPSIPWGPGHWVDDWIPDVNLGAPGCYRSNGPLLSTRPDIGPAVRTGPQSRACKWTVADLTAGEAKSL